MALQDSDLEQSSSSVADNQERERQAVSSTQPRRQTARSLGDGLRFGSYQVIRLIAIGGMSEVYEAMHCGLHKRVALKLLRADLAENPEARERFVSEGVNAALIRHTNVVDVTDVGIVDELPFLVMSLLEGEDLGAVYERQGRLPITDLIDVLLPVASAVAVGHAHGVVHRDLKPDNIFLHREGCRVIPKVLDFGVSRVMSARRITLNASVFGTPHYMSPEQARGAATDARTDQYALGVILYEGITGKLPRDSSNPLELLHAVAFDPFQPPSQHLELPDGLEAVILCAMAHDPEQRFESMRELAQALLPFASPAASEYWSLELRSLPVAEPSDPAEPHALAALVVRHSTPAAPPLPAAKPAPSNAEQAAGAGPPLQFTAASAAAGEAAPVARAESPIPSPLDSPPTAASAARPRRRRNLFWPGALGGALLALGLTWLGTRDRGSGPPGAPLERREFSIDVYVMPPTAAVTLDGRRVGRGHYSGRLARDGGRHELTVAAEGYVTRRLSFRDEPPPARIELVPRPPQPEAARAAESVAPQPPLQAANTRGSSGRSSFAAARARTQQRARNAAAAAAVAANESAAAAASTHVAVVEQAQPRIRLVDELAPRVRVIE